MDHAVHVVGGGVIGLACAWTFVTQRSYGDAGRAGPGSGRASWVAAGMLAPVTEAQFGESALTALLVEGAGRWPAFAAALEGATGHAIGYDTTGTVTVALDASDSPASTTSSPISTRSGWRPTAAAPASAAASSRR